MENKKILLADDENNIVQVMAAKLRNNGFEVLTAEDSPEAYNLYCNQKPDAIVIDYELIEQLGKKAETIDVPMIILTTKDVKLKKNFTERLNKPFSPKELLTYVENVLTVSASK
ncbi:MAG: hypothetical protein A2Y10_06275 [Planctomycetes bacterium GWF2_41_51]|nr:MAG: hypothetical protein A2Y10_06275 [Planctomycetes bacterium GWF2_41_51]